MKSKKEKRDWFDSHVEVIGVNNKILKEKIKKDFIGGKSNDTSNKCKKEVQ